MLWLLVVTLTTSNVSLGKFSLTHIVSFSSIRIIFPGYLTLSSDFALNQVCRIMNEAYFHHETICMVLGLQFPFFLV